jgi:hypothetical protein
VPSNSSTAGALHNGQVLCGIFVTEGIVKKKNVSYCIC